MSAVSPGNCIQCYRPTWKTVPHPVTGAAIILWPKRDTLFASFWTPTGKTMGIGFCPACCPDIGGAAPRLTTGGEAFEVGGAVEIERAHEVYEYWFSPKYGQWLRAWLSDELRLDEPARNRIVSEWEQDRLIATEDKSAVVGEPDDGRRHPE